MQRKTKYQLKEQTTTKKRRGTKNDTGERRKALEITGSALVEHAGNHIGGIHKENTGW